MESLEQGQVHSEQFDQETWALKMVLGDEFTAGDDMVSEPCQKSLWKKPPGKNLIHTKQAVG